VNNLTLIIGGARSGKSDFAQRLAETQTGTVAFVATAVAGDAEMAERIAAHRSARPKGWLTIEAPMGLANAMAPFTEGIAVVLLDCLTLLSSNVLFAAVSESDEESPLVGPLARKMLQVEIDLLLGLLGPVDARLIVVSNEVGEGIVPANRFSRLYRDLLGWANAYMAKRANTVYLMVAGLPVDVKRLARETERDLARP
jgi:adenosylcobinamide kinase / adenosylcobinamide-phosphate guanylyltransferase